MANNCDSPRAKGQDVIYDYLLIEFITRGKKTKRFIDAVPQSWVTYDVKQKKFMCFFPPKPYTKFDDLVKEQAPADKNWDIHNVKVRGHAENYIDALRKICKLKLKENAFSTDTDADSIEKAAHLERALRIQKLHESLAETKYLVYGSKAQSDKSTKELKRKSESNKPLSEDEYISLTERKSDSDSSSYSPRPKKQKKQESAQNIKKKEHKYLSSQTKKLSTSYPDDHQLPSTSNQLLWDACKKSIVDESKLTESNLQLNFPIEAVVGEDGLVVIPDAAGNKISSSTLTVNKIKGKSVGQGVFLTQNHYMTLMEELKSLRVEQRNQSKSILKMESLLQQLLEQKFEGAVGTKKNTWSEIFEMEFPLNEIKNVYVMEKELASNPASKKNFCSAMTYLINKEDSLPKNANAVIKKLFNRELASNFTATRKMPEKIVFAATAPNIFRNIIETLSSDLGKTESRVISAIGSAFTLSQYWEGKRLKASMTKYDGDNLNNF